MALNLDKCFGVAKDVALKAGVMIKEAFSLEKRVECKETIADLVTETDQMVEKMVMSHIRENFPDHSFIGEESVAAGEKCCLTDNPTWIIDPIDGTNNFVHRFPFVCISIGLLVNKKAEVGVVYNPIMDEMYTARPGQGAFCNGTKLKVTDTEDLSQAVLCTEFGSSRDAEKVDAKFQGMRNILHKSHGMRCLGSAALEMCMVAAGSVDAFYEAGIHCWDMAAGELIVKEAGGIVIDWAGGPLDLMNRRVLCAGTEKLAKQVSENIVQIQFERD